MKKAWFLPLLLCSFASVSCDSQPANMKEVNQLKTLLAKQDLSPATAKMFVSNFTQNYDLYSSSRDEEEGEETRFYSYRGGGVVGCFYEVDEAAYQEVEALESHDFFDYLSRGTGSYGMLQTATMAAYHHETEGEEEAKSLRGMGFLQRLENYFGEQDVQVFNSLSSKETVDGNYDKYQYFNGIIDKKTLFDTITPRAFSDIFARTNLYDGQRSCEALDRVYFETLKGLQGKTDAELSDFIAKNALRFEEGEESTMVHFKVGSESLRAALDENEILPGDFEGTLYYEKESGFFNAFDYQILYQVIPSGQNREDIYTTTMEFKANGYSWNKRYDEDLYIEPNPTVYDDAETFLDDVIEEVIPPSI